MRERRQRVQLVTRLVAGDGGQHVVNVPNDRAERSVEDIAFVADWS
jgi:hypothetical protein